MAKYKPGMINVDEYARTVAIEAVKIYRDQEKKDMKNNRVHNMGLLLDHYIDFVEHYDKIKYKASDIQEDLEPEEIEAINRDEISIYSIKRSKIRTMIMIRQIESSVELLQLKMRRKGQIEKYEVIKRLYMDKSKIDIPFNPRVKLVAEEMTAEGIPCSESSVRRWNSEMLNELAPSLFGVDGLRLEL